IDPAAIAGTGHLPPEQLLAVAAGRLLPGREVAPTIERRRGAVGEAAEPMTAAGGLVVASPESQLRSATFSSTETRDMQRRLLLKSGGFALFAASAGALPAFLGRGAQAVTRRGRPKVLVTVFQRFGM